MKKPAGIPGGLSRFRVDLAYDGTDFAGWAKQPGLRTVQNEFVKAFEKLFGPSDNDYGIRIAGRTDAGVHATHQVFHMDLTPEQVQRLGRTPLTAKRLRGLLPGDIGVFQVARAPEGFHARYSATGRSYEYSISDAMCRPDPMNLRYSLQSRRTYDVALMRDAAVGLLGLKEFGAFCRPRVGATTIRELRMLDVVREESGLILIRLEADAFCHNMVRALVGALCAVGEGKLSKDELWKIQTAALRTSKFKVVEPKGLKLVAVSYPADDQLEIQAQKVRKMRLTEEITV
jgi:tRNA pseudouridine38-40 synthase